jgi:hypothetical protein
MVNPRRLDCQMPKCVLLTRIIDSKDPRLCEIYLFGQRVVNQSSSGRIAPYLISIFQIYLQGTTTPRRIELIATMFPCNESESRRLIDRRLIPSSILPKPDPPPFEAARRHRQR